MKTACFIAAALAAAGSPAFATSTIVCTSTTSPTNGPSLSLGVSTGAASGVFQAQFSLGDEQFATGGAGGPTLVQSWIDERQLKLEIADSNAETIITRLDTRRRAGNDYLGILIHRGRTWRVRCSEEG
jgi:hypothetical protein